MGLFAITENSLTTELQRLVRQMDSAGRMKFVMQWGASVMFAAQSNARGKGGRRFWRQIAKATKLKSIGPASVEVATEHVAAMQKQFGGPIEAKGKDAGGAEALTIPIAPEAEGRRAKDFTLGHRLFAIGEDLPERGVLGYNEGGKFVALYALRRRVEHQAPDPYFPEQDEIMGMGQTLAQAIVNA